MMKGYFSRIGYIRIKGCADSIIALSLCILISPLLIAIALLVYASDGLPVLFKQSRVGLDGKVFVIVKFRTLPVSSAGGRSPTRVGRFLRSSSLDELPELFNILKGDMSFVGPRPLLVKYLGFYTKRQHLRHTVKPGLTGLAQANGRSTISWSKKFANDIYYAKNRSICLDIFILYKTVVSVFDKKQRGCPTESTEFNGSILES